MNKKINYADENGTAMKRVVLYLEFGYTGETIETFITVPKSMTDKEIMDMAKDFRDSEIKYGFYYLDED